MSIEQAKQAATHAFIESVREGGGWPVEADDNLNSKQRALIEAMAQHHGTVYLGRVNLYGDDRKKPVKLRAYPDGETVFNFAASFVVPTDDETLKQMIFDRDNAPYTGTAADAVRVEAIHARIAEIGGHLLFWS